MTTEQNKKRTELANAMAEAGRAAIEFDPLAGAALAAIPGTDPQQYVAAGTLENIGRVMGTAGAVVDESAIREVLQFMVDCFGPCEEQYIFSKRLAIQRGRAALAAPAVQAQLLATEVRAAAWIALGNEWPKNNQRVWVTHANNYTNAPTSYSVMEAIYVNGMWSDAHSDNAIRTPTHWMPRHKPEPAIPAAAQSVESEKGGEA